MDFWTTVVIMVRRWYLCVPAFLLTLGLTVLAFAAQPPVYISTGTLLIARTTYVSTPDPASRNPLLQTDYGLGTTAAILTQSLNDPDVQAQIGAGDATAVRYSVATSADTTRTDGISTDYISGPILLVVAQSPTPDESTELVQRIINTARSQLAGRQAALSVAPDMVVAVKTINGPTTPSRQVGSRMRGAAAGFALAVIASLAATYAGDELLIRRQRRRRSLGALTETSDRAGALI